MRRPLVIGNWKMNGSFESNVTLLSAIKNGMGDEVSPELVICPAYPYLAQVQALSGEMFVVGAQNLSAETQGAHTGEVSASMLVDLGVSYVIIGHSERRAMYGDTNEVIKRKFAAAMQQGLKPILCVGETLQQRRAGQTQKVIYDQMAAVLSVTGQFDWCRMVVAYEPVWAIGSGQVAQPEEAQSVHRDIRQQLEDALGAEIAEDIRIAYGGSVKPANASDLFKQADIDGGLIGSASLQAADFVEIIATLN